MAIDREDPKDQEAKIEKFIRDLDSKGEKE